MPSNKGRWVAIVLYERSENSPPCRGGEPKGDESV